MGKEKNQVSGNPIQISDFKLLRRIREYLTEQDDPERISKDSMVEDLRIKYKEYGRRQKAAFRALVFRAYKHIMDNVNNEKDDASEQNSESASDIEVDNIDGVQYKDDMKETDEEDDEEENDNEIENIEDDENSLEFDELVGINEDITNQPIVTYMDTVHRMTNNTKPKVDTESELINISSDDEDDPLPSQDENSMKNSTENNKYEPTRSSKARKTITRFHMLNLPHVRITPVSSIGKGVKRQSDVALPSAKRQKETHSSLVPNISFKLFGGFSKVLKTVSQMVVHIKESEIYETLGVNPPRGFLLHGPPGCGKTLLAQAIAGELGVPLVRVAGPELVGGVSGESESRIRELFDSALNAAPCILFIDEIDAICPPRDTARREMERRIVAQLLTSIDGLSESQLGEKVVIIGATNRPDALDPALRRAGRFDREICLGIPDRTARYEILQVITNGMKLKPGLDLELLASYTPGFVGADLKALTAEAAIAAVNRCLETQRLKLNSKSTENSISTMEVEMVNGVDHSDDDKKTSNLEKTTNDIEEKKSDEPENKSNEGEKMSDETVKNNDEIKIVDHKIPAKSEEIDEEQGYLSILKSKGPLLSREQLEDLFIEMEDFIKALKSVQPSAKREGFATVPDVTWDDIGSLRDIRSELEMSIMMPVKYPKEFNLLGINAPAGILLCGPPGCGKTLLAKAVANEANINFISVKGPELLNMYVGESERAVRQVFQRARNSQPCVIFFDEIDALCPKRAASTEGHNTSSRVVNQVLTEMDGVEGRAGVFLMAATNRPDMVDPAVLRPGRLDKILYVGLPSPSDRTDILRALTKNGTKPPMKDVDLSDIGSDQLLEGYTGADLAALVKEASVLALTEYMEHKDDSQLFVTKEMILRAAAKIRPSVSPREREHYEKLKLNYGPSGQLSKSPSVS